MLAVEPYRVEADGCAVEDLRQRLERTRWPQTLPGSAWDYGADLSYVQTLCGYWCETYDWRAFEARHNAHPQFLASFDGQPLHFYHVRSPEPQARPLLLSHGWPSSSTEFLDVLGPLSDPRRHGGRAEDAFHLVVPSLPGFGFSGPTLRRGYRLKDMAAAFHQLMLGLGYEHYFAQGGDWGAPITMLLGGQHPQHVDAIHLNLISGAAPPDPQRPHEGLSAAEIDELRANLEFSQREGAYQQIQRTKPQTLAYGLTDSPAALAAWIVEKFRSWTDCQGDPESIITRDRLLDNISIYWLTGTIHSSMRLYFEETGPDRQPAFPERVTVPTGHARYPREIYKFPRAWAETRYHITQWRNLPRGGHFPAMEVPELYVETLRDFFRDHRPPA